MDQVRPDFRDMQSTGLIDQIYLRYPDLSKKISQYINFRWILNKQIIYLIYI